MSIINLLDSLWETHEKSLFLPGHFSTTSSEYTLILKFKKYIFQNLSKETSSLRIVQFWPKCTLCHIIG